MKINSVKIISLLFFVLSAFYLYTAHQIQVFAFDEGAPFNAKTFPIYLGYAGMFFSGLKIVLPDQKPIEVDPTYLEFKKTILLVITMIFYGATILKIGFFLSTSLFLVFSIKFLNFIRLEMASLSMRATLALGKSSLILSSILCVPKPTGTKLHFSHFPGFTDQLW